MGSESGRLKTHDSELKTALVLLGRSGHVDRELLLHCQLTVVGACSQHIRAWRAEGGRRRGMSVLDRLGSRIEDDRCGPAPLHPRQREALRALRPAATTGNRGDVDGQFRLIRQWLERRWGFLPDR